MRILLTNITLATGSGTEYFIRDLALALRRRGHHCIVYTFDPGAVADAIRAAGVEVISDLRALTAAPDIIHGQHSVPTMAALCRFPTTPAIFVVHDRVQWTDAPPRHPRIGRYVAVDDCCRERFEEAGLPGSATTVILNAVDLERFRQRPPLPPRPRRALLFSNYIQAATGGRPLREACTALGIELATAGALVGGAHPRPEEILGGYDLVFGKGRCALEALAVGCAVVVCDVAGVGGLVTPDNLARLRRLNFGRRTLTEPLTVEILTREIAAYDAAACTTAARRLRSQASVETQAAQFEAVYRNVLAAAAPTDAAAETRAVADWLPEMLPAWQQWAQLWRERDIFQDAARRQPE